MEKTWSTHFYREISLNQSSDHISCAWKVSRFFDEWSFGKKVLTIWSAPNYCFRFKNLGFAAFIEQGNEDVGFLHISEAEESLEIDSTLQEPITEVGKYFF